MEKKKINKQKYKKKYIWLLVGFRETIGMLSNGEMSLKAFNYEFNTNFSYYNAFSRVRKRMIILELIKIEKREKKYIKLTEKGKKAKEYIDGLIELTSGEKKNESK